MVLVVGKECEAQALFKRSVLNQRYRNHKVAEVNQPRAVDIEPVEERTDELVVPNLRPAASKSASKRLRRGKYFMISVHSSQLTKPFSTLKRRCCTTFVNAL